MEYVPDHPIIRNMELTGYPDGRVPFVIGECYGCGAEIYDGIEYDLIDGELYCKQCIEEAEEME